MTTSIPTNGVSFDGGPVAGAAPGGVFPQDIWENAPIVTPMQDNSPETAIARAYDASIAKTESQYTDSVRSVLGSQADTLGRVQAIRDAEVAVAQRGTQLRADAAETARKIAAVLADDTLYPDGRERLARELQQGYDERAQAYQDQAAVHVEVARAVAFTAALPPAPTGEAALLARQDAQLLLARGVAPAQLASRGDQVAALIVSDWGKDYLASAPGVAPGDAARLHTALQVQALNAAAQGTDPARRAAAVRYHALSHLPTVASANVLAARAELDAGRGRVSGQFVDRSSVRASGRR